MKSIVIVRFERRLLTGTYSALDPRLGDGHDTMQREPGVIGEGRVNSGVSFLAKRIGIVTSHAMNNFGKKNCPKFDFASR